MQLNDESSDGDNDNNAANLKHGTGKDAHIVLSPQPSNDPNDPLNWPRWKKEMIIAVLAFGGMLNAGTNVVLPPQMAKMAKCFKKLIIDT